MCEIQASAGVPIPAGLIPRLTEVAARLAAGHEDPHPRSAEAVAARGARSSDGATPHLLACLDHGSGVVPAQAAVDGRTNEIPMFTALPGQAGDLGEVLVTADALHA